VKAKHTLTLLLGTLLLLPGCLDLDLDIPPEYEDFMKCAIFIDLSLDYYFKSGQWPSSLEEFRSICEQPDTYYEDVNWTDYASADFRELDNGGVHMDITLTDGKGQWVADIQGPFDVNHEPNGPVQFRFESPNLVCQRINEYDLSFFKKEQTVTVSVDHGEITKYMYRDDVSKPILHPLKSPNGTVLTRSYPFDIIEGETTDHPHHTGLFFTYDDVAGEGFWNNPKPPPQIKQIGDVKMHTDPDKGTLETTLHWTAKDGTVLLGENRTMTFTPSEDQYTIDFTMELTAQNKKIEFGDTKEGMFAIRLADWLREQGGTGEYLSSNGDKTEKNIWGKRAKWVRIEAQDDFDDTHGIAIINHPDSVNYPTYWHARGYGLFAANPLGQEMFQQTRKVENPEPFALKLEPGEKVIFKFRLLVYDGARTPEQIEKISQQYTTE